MTFSPETNESIRVECAARGEFQNWIARAGGSLVLTTYQAGKVATIGWDGRQVTFLMRQFDKPLGMAIRGDQLALATRHEISFFANARLLAGDYLEHQPGRYDGLFLPRATFHTGDLHTHDIAFEGEDLLLVNTRFSCLARLSRDFSFEPVWKPKFVSDLVPEDRCHLNGLALRDGQARYVTALGTTDTPGGWRENKAAGGVVVDVQSDEIVLSGLSMPHSPRWHEGRLWVLNSGAGELLVADPDGTDPEPQSVCSLPGYLRGLCFVGPYALVGMCKIREKHVFGGLPVQGRYERLLCGVAIIDLRSRSQVAMFEFTAGCEELYDVHFLPGILRPTILNLEKPAVRQAVTNPESSYWLRPSSEVPINPDSDFASLSGPGSESRQAAPQMFPDSGTPL
jgi:uncharacterized protein (TIGR03032 family)